MTTSRQKIGIIGGSGELPLHVARSLAAGGKSVYMAAIEGAAQKQLEGAGWKTGWYKIHNLQQLVDGLEKEGIDGVVLAGRVAHAELFKGNSFDASLQEFLETLPDHRGATILGGVVRLFMDKGIEVLSLKDVVPDLMPAAGHLAGPVPPAGFSRDLSFGWRIARSVADLDIGQTVVVKDRSVVAVEGMEGTDGAIDRAVAIAGKGLTVVKLAAADHDFRFDVPTIGKETVSRIAESGGGALVVESGRCMILGFDDVTALCERGGVSLLSCRERENGEILWDDQ